MIDVQAYLCVFVCIIGLILYFLPGDTKPKVAEVGRIMFFCGLLVTLLQFMSHVIKL